MNYIILVVVLLGLLTLMLFVRYYLLRSNYDKYIDLTASLLLAKDRYHRNRLHGSIIFELKKYNERLTDVQITDIKSTNNETIIKDFERLHFDLNKREGNGHPLSSISVLITEREAYHRKRNKGAIYIAGVLNFPDRSKKHFAKKVSVDLIDRE